MAIAPFGVPGAAVSPDFQQMQAQMMQRATAPTSMPQAPASAQLGRTAYNPSAAPMGPGEAEARAAWESKLNQGTSVGHTPTPEERAAIDANRAAGPITPTQAPASTMAQELQAKQTSMQAKPQATRPPMRRPMGPGQRPPLPSQAAPRATVARQQQQPQNIADARQKRMASLRRMTGGV